MFDKLGGTISAEDLCWMISGLLCYFLQLDYPLLSSSCKTITLSLSKNILQYMTKLNGYVCNSGDRRKFFAALSLYWT